MGLTLSDLSHWFLLSGFIYWLCGWVWLDYDNDRGESTLGFLVAQGISALILTIS